MNGRAPQQFRWPGGFWRSLLSILLGNAIYFSSLSWLPPGARHEPNRFDWGLAVDLWICVAVYGLSWMIWRPRRR